MHLSVYELCVGIGCIVVAIMVMVVCRKNRGIFEIMAAILGLFGLLAVVHWLFCYYFYRTSFPMSSIMDVNESFALSASDWLTFLGSYFGFSGSLVMSFLIYRQSKIINDFTISEYSPYIGLVTVTLETISKSYFVDQDLKKDEKLDLIRSPRNSSDLYYTSYCVPNASEEKNFRLSAQPVLIFTEIKNYSKSAIHNISLKEIELTDLVENSRLHYCFRKEYDPIAVENRTLFSGDIWKRCFYLNDVPDSFEMGKITFFFEYGKKSVFKSSKEKTLKIVLLASKNRGESMEIRML